MTLNSVMAVILHHFTEISSFGSQLRHNGWSQTDTVYDKNVIQRIYFSAIYNLWWARLH